MFGKNLDGHDAVKPRISGAIHLSHPADADRGDDLVGAQSGCGLEGHGGGVSFTASVRGAEWQRLKALVLDSVSSPITRRVYNMALDEFIDWFRQAPRPGFTSNGRSGRVAVLEHRPAPSENPSVPLVGQEWRRHRRNVGRW